MVESIPSDVRVKKLDKDTMVNCDICTKTHRLRNLRNHVGYHILRAKFNLTEKDLKQPVRTIGESQKWSLIQ